MKQSNISLPKISFKDFSSNWIMVSLKDICSVLKGEQINKSKLMQNGTYYVLNGGISPSGYFNKYNVEANTISISEGGNSCGYVNFNESKFWSGGHNYTLQKVKIDSRYLYAYLKSQENLIMSKRVGTGLPNIQKTVLENLIVVYPDNKEEQKLIGNFFYEIEQRIALLSEEITSLKHVKYASMQSMFPIKGELKPRVRFKNFDQNWQSVQLTEVFEERHEISTITENLPQLSFTISDGVIFPEDRKTNKRDFLIKDISSKKYLVTYWGDIIYNPANVVYGAIHRNSLTDGVVSPIYKIFKTNQDSGFMECIVRNPDFISRLSMKTEGTVTKLKTLKPDSFLSMKVMIPASLDEQRLISEYFQNIDKQITLKSQSLEKLVQLKSACLNKMFN